VLFDFSLLFLSRSYLYNKKEKKVDKIAFKRDAKKTKKSEEKLKRDKDKININREED